jgi:uracil-DNA glycosylase
MIARREHFEQCRAFLHHQIARVKPRLLATLGIPPRSSTD